MRRKPEIQTDYLGKIYRVNDFVKVVEKAARHITAFRKKQPFDAIAFTGTSGAALAYPLSVKLKLPLICVRKSKRDNHFGSKIEGVSNARTYIIVDDFIASGTTIKKIRKSVVENSYNPYGSNYKEPKLVGIYLYDHDFDRGDVYKDIPLIGTGKYYGTR